MHLHLFDKRIIVRKISKANQDVLADIRFGKYLIEFRWCTIAGPFVHIAL